MIKKILSAFLASTFVLSSAAFATGGSCENKEEKAPKIQTEDSSQEETLKPAKNQTFLCQKAFLTALACIFNIDIEIKFIPDKNKKNYDFTILRINDSDFEYADWPLAKQSRYLSYIVTTEGTSLRNNVEIKLDRYTIQHVKINNHILTQNFISELSNLILEMIYNKKTIAIEKNDLNRPVNLNKDEFKSEITDMLSDLFRDTTDSSLKIHKFFLPPI